MRAKDNVTQADAGTSIAGCALDDVPGRPETARWGQGVCVFVFFWIAKHCDAWEDLWGYNGI